MVDTSKFTIDTPVKIKILKSGYYIPELKSNTPLQCYASISEVISIMNRGIVVEFPAEEKNEISTKIEDIILDYEEKRRELRPKYGEVGTDVSKALDTVQEINESKITPEEEKLEQEQHIFNYEAVKKRVAKNLTDTSISRIFDSDDFKNSENRISGEERLRKSRERLRVLKKEALEMSKLEAEALQNLSNVAKFNNESFEDKFGSNELDFDTPATPKPIPVKKNPFS